MKELGKYERFLIDEVRPGIVMLTINRPDKLNAMDPTFFQELTRLMQSISETPAVRVAILTGGGRAFSAGGDIATFPQLTGDPEKARMHLRLVFNSFHSIEKCRVPVIAAVHGHALGGGIQIALGADIRIVHPDTQMAVREVHWGLVPDMTGTLVLSRLARPDVVKELVFTARVFSGKEAFELGLATRLSATPFDDAMAMAQEIADRSPDAIRGSKELLNRLFAAGAAEQFAEERRVIGALIGKANQVEAVTANFEKRKTAFIDPA